MKLLKILITIMLLTCIVSCDEVDSNLNIHIIADIHYSPHDLFEYTSKFKETNDNSGTMKQVKYSEDILDAYINEELENKPDYIFITGDMVYSGSINTHKAIVNKLQKLLDNNIRVLVIPGNHDFDSRPYIYQDDIYIDLPKLEKEEFEEIYMDFGYREAYSKDENSLSYSYKLNNYNFVIMLDTLNIYGYTDGELKTETLNWIEKQLEYANSKNYNIIIAGHHNIFIHNEMFDYGYRLNNSEKLIALLIKYNVHLYLSGHMHIQDIKNEHGINEILTESFSIYPHQYGELLIAGKDYSYNTKKTNIESYYKNSTNSDLKNYDEYGLEFAIECNRNKFIKRYFDSLNNIDNKEEYLNLISLINVEYFAGNKLELSNDEISLLNSVDISNYFKTISKLEEETSTNGSLK